MHKTRPGSKFIPGAPAFRFKQQKRNSSTAQSRGSSGRAKKTNGNNLNRTRKARKKPTGWREGWSWGWGGGQQTNRKRNKSDWGERRNYREETPGRKLWEFCAIKNSSAPRRRVCQACNRKGNGLKKKEGKSARVQSRRFQGRSGAHPASMGRGKTWGNVHRRICVRVPFC